MLYEWNGRFYPKFTNLRYQNWRRVTVPVHALKEGRGEPLGFCRFLPLRDRSGWFFAATQ